MESRDIDSERGEPILLDAPGCGIDQQRGADLHDDTAKIREGWGFVHCGRHGCQAGAPDPWSESEAPRVPPIADARARNTSGTPAPAAAEIAKGVFLLARLRRASCCLISSADMASVLFRATISGLSATPLP